MDGTFRDNDISKVVEADRAHIWHHLIQHKPFETTEPRIIVEGRGMRVWDQNGKEHQTALVLPVPEGSVSTSFQALDYAERSRREQVRAARSGGQG